MKRNKLFIFTLAVCASILGACSTELETSGNPDRAGAGEAIVTVALQFPQADKPEGYAGDVPAGVALDDEKEIKSIAFIAFTKGGTGIYLSTKPTLDDNGFTKPLTPVEGQPAGNYTASFKIRSSDFGGKSTLVAIANFDEHNLTFDPEMTIGSLQAKLTEALQEDESIGYPLLMTIAKEVDITEGQTLEGEPFVMERIMARIDVVNNAYNKTTPANDFVLTSARLLSAASQGTMIGGVEIATPTYVDLATQVTVNEVDPGEGAPIKQQLAPMYVYENTNTNKADGKLAATATKVRVTGTYKGKAYSKDIPFILPEKVVEGVKQDEVIVPIARNTRYVIEVTSSIENEPAFALKVTDWTDGKTLDVEIDFAPPVFEGLEDFTPGADAVWDAETRTLNITKATAGSEFNLIVRGNQDSDFRVETDYDANDTPIADLLTVKRGELSGYADSEEAGSLNRTYTINIPQFTGDKPSQNKIIVYNTSYADAQTEITVKYAPFFVGDWVSSQPAATIDPATNLIDLKKVTDGQSGTVSFFTSSNSAMTVSELTNKGVTNDFYSMTTVDEDKKYGPGKRITLSYKALSDKPEFAEVQLTDAETTAKKVLIKCFRKPIALMTKVSATPANALLEGTDKLYLAVNNGNHGTIDYTVYNDAANPSTIAPTAVYAKTSSSSPDWVKEGTTVTKNEVVETYSEFNIVKSAVSISLPTKIKNPAAVTSFTLGIANEPAAFQLVPVYISGTTITDNDKTFQPVLVKGIWWAPMNIGQTKIPAPGDLSSEAGNIFQWGRKQALTFESPSASGPVASEEAAGTNFIKAADWWITPPNDQLWNAGDETTPIKTSSDPCPVGWRVPTSSEYVASVVGWHTYVGGEGNANSNNCLIISGESGLKLYFPAAGNRNQYGGIENQGIYGFYWAATSGITLLFNKAEMRYPQGKPKAMGNFVRCIQE